MKKEMKIYFLMFLAVWVTACSAASSPPEVSTFVSSVGEPSSSAVSETEAESSASYLLKNDLPFTSDDVDYLIFERWQFDATITRIGDRRKISEVIELLGNIQVIRENQMSALGPNGTYAHDEICRIFLKDGTRYNFHSIPDYLQLNDNERVPYSFLGFFDKTYFQLYGNGKDWPDGDMQGNEFAYLPQVPVLSANIGKEKVSVSLHSYNWDDNEHTTLTQIPQSAYMSFSMPQDATGACELSYDMRGDKCNPELIVASAYLDPDFYLFGGIQEDSLRDIRTFSFKEYKLPDYTTLKVDNNTIYLPLDFGVHFIEITAMFEQGQITYFLSYEVR